MPRTATPRTRKPEALVPCPRCDNSSGYIAAFGGIANGICFKCAGTGTVKAGKVKPPRPLTPYQEKLVHMIFNSDFTTMTYEQLLYLRDTALWHTKQVPTLMDTWRARGGEKSFQERQRERLEAIDAQRLRW